MKITNRVIDRSFPALNELTSLKLPAKGAYGVARNMTKIRSALEDLQTVYKKIVEEYADKDDNGAIIFLEDGNTSMVKNKEVCEAALIELMEMELDIEPHQIKIDDFGTTEVSVGTLLTLDWLITQ